MEGELVLPHDGNPFLFIRLTEVSYLRLTGYEEPMTGRAIGHAAARECEGRKGLDLVDFMGAMIRVEYFGSTEFLALRSQDGRPLDLSEARPRPAVSAVEKPWWKFW